MITINNLFEKLDQAKLTRNHYKIVAAAAIGDMLEFYDYFIIGFILAFIVGPWQLNFSQTAILLLTAGVGGMLGAFFWGYIADIMGRRPVMINTILTFSIASGIMYFTPEGDWIFLSILRFVVGFGVGGLYVVDLPLVQEFVPSRYRGILGGVATAFVPMGTLLGSASAAYLTPIIGWRGLFLIGVLPALFTLVVRAWVPESPRWLISKGRYEEAAKSINWVTGSNIDVSQIVACKPGEVAEEVKKVSFVEIFKYPRSVITSWLINLCQQTADYGFTAWAAMVLTLVLQVSGGEAARLFISVAFASVIGKWVWAFSSEWLGRRVSGMLMGIGATVFFVVIALYYNSYWGTVPVIWLAFMGVFFFMNGGWSVTGPYSSEVWPRHLRATGMGSAYGFGGIGKFVGPMVLAYFAGSSNLVTPKATTDAIGPAYTFMAVLMLIVTITYYFGYETRNKSIEEIDEMISGTLIPSENSPKIKS